MGVAETRFSTRGAIVGVARRRRRWPWIVGALGAVALGGLGFAFFAWPGAVLATDGTALARVRLPSFGSAGARVSARTADGTRIPIVVHRDGSVWPTRRVPAGTAIVVDAFVRRPGWVGWIAGHEQRLELRLVAPSARPLRQWLQVPPGITPEVTFDRPVREIRLLGAGRPVVRRLPKPQRTVSLGRVGPAGSVRLAAVSLPWAEPPPATTITWFPPGPTQVLATPRAGSTLRYDARLSLRFSRPVSAVLHGEQPRLRPAVPGRWSRRDAHTLEFVPRGYGFGLGRRIRVVLPSPARIAGRAARTTTVAWRTATPSPLRLQQLLAELGYLPVAWTSTRADAARTTPGELAAALSPPSGTFTWRYPNVPPELGRLWSPGQPNQIVRGAVMTFQDRHGLTVDGFAGPEVWQALIADVIAGHGKSDGYSYVYVHRSVPQSLNLWHDGQVILSSPGNTGVPAAPTQLGTFPVFEHIPVGTMSGTNPDGSRYNDPGVRYISYFNGGDAIHAFNRGSFGTPQSLGCVELPLAAAARVWPYTPVGTLVTIEN